MKYSNYYVVLDNGFVTLESELYLDQFLGFTATGDALSPHKVHPDGFCSKFLVRVMNFVSCKMFDDVINQALTSLYVRLEHHIPYLLLLLMLTPHKYLPSYRLPW